MSGRPQRQPAAQQHQHRGGSTGAAVREPEVVRIGLLGGFRLRVGPRLIEEDRWRLRKARSLLKLLALAPSHHLHREQVMEALWPELGVHKASNNLHQILHAARRAIESAAPAGSNAASRSGYLVLSEEQLSLCPDSPLWVDVEAFEQAAATARHAMEPAAFRAAIDLYAGELLPEDRYEPWVEERRAQLRELYLSLLLQVSALYEERRAFELGIEALSRVVSQEPTHEGAQMGLMRLYALLGRRREALSHYERLREALYKEFGREPEAATTRLQQKIWAGTFPHSDWPLASSPPKEEVPSAAGPAEATSRRHNLPIARTSFVGRGQEMVEVKRELAVTRLLTLTGVGGLGKTRLALEVARSLVGTYTDGVWFVELAPILEGELIPQAVAGVLEIRERPDQPLADTLVEALRGKEVLLVLDNCEHLVDAAALLVDALLDSCPHLTILATSREALGVTGELRWPMPPLSVPNVQRPTTAGELKRSESVRLFTERARQRNHPFALTIGNARAVAEICRRLEGLPLAIELAAAKTKLLPPQAMLARLGSRLKLLTGGARNLPQRQRTLRATIEWSYELLDERDKTLFAWLSVFSGGCTLEAVEVVCDARRDLPIDVLEGVASLLDKNLIGQEEGVEGEPRFVMLETIHEYARERLEESGEAEEVRRLHAEYFVALAEEAEPELWGAEDAACIGRLEAEHDNFRAALSWSLGGADVKLGLRLAGVLGGFWYARGYYEEGKRWLEEALAMDGCAPAAAHVKALEALGWLANERGDMERAEAAAEEGLKLGTLVEIESTRKACLLRMLGATALLRGDHERARELYEESVALSREAGDRRGIAHALITLAWAAAMRGDHEHAKELYEEGLVLSRELGGARLLGDSLIALGWEYLLEGDLEQATALSEEAAALLRERGYRGHLHYALDNLAWAALLRGDHERARKLHEDSLELCQELGNRTIAAESLEGLACGAGARGEAKRAAKLFGAAESFREAVGYWQEPRECMLRESYLTAARSQMDEASWEEAFTEGQAMGTEEAVEYALSEEDVATPSAPPQSNRRPADEPLAALTSREQEIALLVAQGLTNRQIAQELSISERTVENHIGKILKKQGFSSRARIATWVAHR